MYAVLIEILTEYAIADLTQGPIDKQRWAKKVFKIYKMIRDSETQLQAQVLISQKIFKLVLVLYN